MLKVFKVTWIIWIYFFSIYCVGSLEAKIGKYFDLFLLSQQKIFFLFIGKSVKTPKFNNNGVKNI